MRVQKLLFKLNPTFKISRGVIGKLLYKTLRVLFLVVLVICVTVLFVFLRHRQLCGYQSYVDSGELEVEEGMELCPNLLSRGDFGVLVGNAFAPRVLASLKPAEGNTSFGTGTAQTCSDPINPVCWVAGTKPKLKNTAGFTNMLLVGVDSRGGNSRLMNTDTILMASLDNNSGKVMFISFPRDLYLNYRRPNGAAVSYKINAVYAIDGVEGIKGVVEQLTGKTVHYYAFVDIALFAEVIDRLGGINITLEEDFEELYPCSDVPAGTACNSPSYMRRNSYGLFKYPAGDYLFNSFDALVYVRSRQLTLDFGRAERQQHLLRAIMQSVLSTEKPLTEKLSTYLDLYGIFKSRVISNIELEDVAALFTIIDKLDGDKAAQVVVDWDLGGRNRIVKYIGMMPGVGWSIGFVDTTHNQFRSYLNHIWNNLAFYLEKPKVLIINKSDTEDISNLEGIKALSQNEFVEVKIIESEEVSTGVRLYDLSGKAKGSLRDIKELLPESLIFSARLDKIIQSDFNEDIVIYWGN